MTFIIWILVCFLPLAFVCGFSHGEKSAKNNKEKISNNNSTYPIDIEQLCQRIENGYFEISSLQNCDFCFKSNKMYLSIAKQGSHWNEDRSLNVMVELIENGKKKDEFFFTATPELRAKVEESVRRFVKSKIDTKMDEMDIDKGAQIIKQLDTVKKL